VWRVGSGLLALGLGLALSACCSTDPAGLSDADPDVRRERLACMGAAAPDDPAVRGVVHGAAVRALDPGVEDQAGVRAAADRVLEVLDARTDAVTLAAHLSGPERDPSPWVRAATASALGALGGRDAAAALRLAVQGDPSADVRLAAARELGDMSEASPETIEVLLDALRDESQSVRANARRALRSILAVDLGLDPAAWRVWLEQRGAPLPEVPRGPAAPPIPYPYGAGADERLPDARPAPGPDEGGPDDEGAPIPDEDDPGVGPR
jgi:hypothetical protein